MTDAGGVETPEAEAAAWEALSREINGYLRDVADAAQADRPALLFIRCAGCSRPPVGRVVHGRLGLMLVTVPTGPLFTGPAPDSANRIRRAHGRPDIAPVGFVLAGPNTIGARFPWWSPGDEGSPAVFCPEHGRIPVDVLALLACRTSARKPGSHKVIPVRP